MPQSLPRQAALGQIVVRELLARGMDVVAIGRNRAKLEQLSPMVEKRLVDLVSPIGLRAALADASIIASCAPASYLSAILSSLPNQAERLVGMASSRRYSENPDATAFAAMKAESPF